MTEDSKNIDLLQKFIENEKKAKLWTILTVILFSLLAFGVIYLAWKLKDAQKVISLDQKIKLAQADSIKVLSKELDIALAKADSLNETLASENESLLNRKANYAEITALRI